MFRYKNDIIHLIFQGPIVVPEVVDILKSHIEDPPHAAYEVNRVSMLTKQ